MADDPKLKSEMPGSARPTQTPTLSFLRVKSNQILDEENALREKAKAAEASPEVRSLIAGFIDSRFHEAENAKSKATEDMMDSLRRRKGEYSADHLAKIKQQGGCEIFVKVTEVKCNAAEAWISDVALPSEGTPWSLDPTPKPDLPPQVVMEIVETTKNEFLNKVGMVQDQDVIFFAKRLREMALKAMKDEAKRRADRMAEHIADQFVEGGFNDETDDVISDVVTFGTGIMRGPFVQNQRTLEWLEGEDWIPEVTDKPMLKWQAVSPLNFFPSPGATTTRDMTYACERDHFTRRSLIAMIGVEGWSEDRIRAVLKLHPRGVKLGLDTDPERERLEDRTVHGENPDQKFDGLWYGGSCPGWLLAEWGMTGLDSEKDYDILALKIGAEVVHVRFNNDPLRKSWWNKTVYKKIKGSFWGCGVPRLMDDTQDACNATARALINNLAIGSGPQVEISDVDALAEGEKISSMYPWRIWKFTDPNRRGGQVMHFFQPEIYSTELMAVFDRFLQLADDRTGIPEYTHGGGENTTGAGSTATGLSILLNSASRVLKKTIAWFDQYMIRPNVESTFVWDMLYVDDPTIKGDVRIVASGAMGLFVKEQRQLRLAEAMEMASKPPYVNIIKPAGHAALLRQSFKGLDVPVDDVVPTKEDIEQEMSQLQAVPGAVPGGGQQLPGGAGAPVPALPAAAGR